MDGLKSEDVSPEYESDSSENQNPSAILLASPLASDRLRAAEQSPIASEGPPGKKKRSSFTIAYKLEVVAYAEKYGLRSASRWFGVEETLLRRWKDQKPYMEMMKDADKTLKRRLPWVAKRMPVGAAEAIYSAACSNSSSSNVTAGAAMDQLTTHLIVNPLIGQPPPPHHHPIPVSAVSTCTDTDLRVHQMQTFPAEAMALTPPSSIHTLDSSRHHQPTTLFVVQDHSTPASTSTDTRIQLRLEATPTLPDMVRCSRCIQGDLSLLASAVDVPDDNMDILRKQYKSTQAQALQLLKVWNRDLGGSREELHDLLISAGFTEAAHSLLSDQMTVKSPSESHHSN